MILRAGSRAAGRCCLVIFLALLAVPVRAQYSRQYKACDARAKTQNQLNECANTEAAREDAELSRIYRKLLSKVAAEPEAAGKIEAAEKAWTVYRDAYIEATFPENDKQAEYGTVFPMEADLLRAALTRRHIREMSKLLLQYK